MQDLAEHVLDSGPRPGKIFEVVGDVGVAQSPPRAALDAYAEPRGMALHGLKWTAPHWQGCTGSLVEGNGWQRPWEAPQLLFNVGLGVRAVVHEEDFMIGSTAVALVVDPSGTRAQELPGRWNLEEEASGHRLERTLR